MRVPKRGGGENGETEFKVDLKGKFGLKLCLSVGASKNLSGSKAQGIEFKSAENAEEDESEAKASAKANAESYFIPKGTIKKDDRGVCVKAKLDFTGLVITAILEFEYGSWVSVKRERNYVLIDPITDLWATEDHYVLEEPANADEMSPVHV